VKFNLTVTNVSDKLDKCRSNLQKNILCNHSDTKENVYRTLSRRSLQNYFLNIPEFKTWQQKYHVWSESSIIHNVGIIQRISIKQHSLKKPLWQY